MPEGNTPPADGQQGDPSKDGGASEPKPVQTFTQAEVDRIAADRAARERAKFADYDDLKAKAAQVDAAEEAKKDELQKAKDAATKAQSEGAKAIATANARLRKAVILAE